MFNVGVKKNPVCVRLYDRDDFVRLRRADGKARFEPYDLGPWDEGQQPCLGPPKAENSDMVLEGDSRRQSIAVTLVSVDKVSALVRVRVHEDVFASNVFQGSRLRNTMQFEVSRFDLPYMDNTKMSDGSRFALVLREVDIDGKAAELSTIRFHSDFISLRDCPYFEEMIKKLQGTETDSSIQ